MGKFDSNKEPLIIREYKVIETKTTYMERNGTYRESFHIGVIDPAKDNKVVDTIDY
jgi:hypothetical protein